MQVRLDTATEGLVSLYIHIDTVHTCTEHVS